MLSSIAADHVQRPRNAWPLEGATHTGLSGSPGDGPHVQIWLFIDGEVIRKATYELAEDLCGEGDPLGCKGVNDQLPICTKGNPNWDACGRAIFGGNPNAGNRGTGNDGNFSNWPRQSCQLSWLPEPFCWIGAEYCCMECKMRVCCYFGPGHPPRQGPPAPIKPPPPVPGPIMPGMPVPVPPGHSPIWQ